MDGWKKVENAVVSICSVGLAVDNEAARDAHAAVSAAQAFICDLFPAVMLSLRSEDEDMRLTPVPFLQAYANKLKSGLKRQNTLPSVSRLLISSNLVFCCGNSFRLAHGGMHLDEDIVQCPDSQQSFPIGSLPASFFDLTLLTRGRTKS